MKKITLKITVILTVIILFFSQYSDMASPKQKNTLYPSAKELITVIDNVKITNPKHQNHIRIMSYNLLSDSFGFEGTDAETRAEGVCSILNTLSPDIVGLQEMSRNWYTCIQENTTYSFISPLRTKLSGTMTSIIYDSNTLSLIKSGEKVFQYGYDSRLRRMVWGIFRKKSDNKIFIVINTHFSLSNDNSATPMKQATELLDFGKEIYTKYDCPAFFIGDFNARERNSSTNNSSAVYETLCTAFTDTKSDSLSVSGGINQGIKASSNDHIFSKGDVEINNYVIMSQNEFKALSDHYPIFIDVAF